MGREGFRYEEFAEHPRYGRGPRFTGLNPTKESSPGCGFPWWLDTNVRIPNTAVKAQILKQRVTYTPGLVYFYFDTVVTCAVCGKQFIFFAEEQKFWYETLKFILSSWPKKCEPCRREERKGPRLKAHYDELLALPSRTVEQNIEIALTCMKLIELGSFTPRKCEFVRSLLHLIREREGDEVAVLALYRRVEVFEAKQAKPE